MLAPVHQVPLIPEVTARHILAALRAYHAPQPHVHGAEWAFFEELRIGTGFGGDAEQRIDAWAICLWPSSGLRRVAYEVKVSRSDFLKEIKQPKKRRRAMVFSNNFYFATPPGLLKVEEVPPECGLVEVSADGKLNWRILAPHRDTPPPSWRFLAAIARLAAKHQAT